MKRADVYRLLTVLIANIMFSAIFMAGCGDDEDDNANLYEELVGNYELIRAEITYEDGSESVVKPPEVTGRMTISSDRKITQEYELYNTPVNATGTFEIHQDKEIIEINQGDLIVSLTYTWDGSVLTTTVDIGTYIEKDFWRKL